MPDADLSYRPRWAPHVVGSYPPRQPDGDGGWEPQTVRMRCERCGGEARVECRTGAVRQKVLKFATMHLHRDPLGK